MYSCSNQHCASLWPIRQHQLWYPPKRLCSPRSGWNPSPLCILPLPLLFPTCFPPFPCLTRAFPTGAIQLDSCLHANTLQLRPSNLQSPGLHLQLYSNELDSTMLSHVLWYDVRVNSSNFFTYAFTGSCRALLCIVVPLSDMHGSADVNVGSNN